MSEKQVLLTGASGFVGRQVLKALLSNGAFVRVITRPDKAHTFHGLTGVETILTDDLFAEPEPWWMSCLDAVDSVVHCAWYTEPGLYLHSVKNLDCLAGTLRMAKVATQSGVRHFLGVGTCFEYDVRSGYLRVDTPLHPQTLYASSKASTYLVLRELLAHANVDFSWCRLFYLYGEGEDERRLVPYLHSKLRKNEDVELTEGTQIRDYMDVKEAGRQITQIATRREVGVFNICTGMPVTVRQLCESIADQYGRRHLLKFGRRAPNAMDPPCVVGVRS